MRITRHLSVHELSRIIINGFLEALDSRGIQEYIYIYLSNETDFSVVQYYDNEYENKKTNWR